MILQKSLYIIYDLVCNLLQYDLCFQDLYISILPDQYGKSLAAV